MSNLESKALNINDLRGLAKKRLTKALFDFCDKGSEDQISIRDNRRALDKIKLMPRVLRDVSKRNPAVGFVLSATYIDILVPVTSCQAPLLYH